MGWGEGKVQSLFTSMMTDTCKHLYRRMTGGCYTGVMAGVWFGGQEYWVW